MEPFRYHVFVCTQEKPEGVPCCSASGSPKLLAALHGELGRRHLERQVQVTTCGCLGLCDGGPVMITYPDGVWYSKVTAEDVPEIVSSHLQQGKPVSQLQRTDSEAMKTEIDDHYDRYLAMLRAKDEAGVLPDNLNDMVRGFMSSRTVLTALELDVFAAVADGATAEDVARRVSSDARATDALLNALVSLNLLSKVDGQFRNAPIASRFFLETSRDNARPALLHMVNLWNRWSKLTDCVRTGAPAADARTQDGVKAFIAAMDRNARERAAAVVKAAGGITIRHMLDLGGGSGAYSIAFARAFPDLHALVFDLPEVISITKEHLRQAGLTDRIGVQAGDMLTDALGSGYDLVLLSAISHMFSPAQNQVLYRRAYEALHPGGRLVVQDFILEPDKTRPRFAALFALNMLVGTKAGGCYTEREFTSWLQAAGFAAVTRTSLPGPSGLLMATRQ